MRLVRCTVTIRQRIGLKLAAVFTGRDCSGRKSFVNNLIPVEAAREWRAAGTSSLNTNGRRERVMSLTHEEQVTGLQTGLTLCDLCEQLIAVIRSGTDARELQEATANAGQALDLMRATLCWQREQLELHFRPTLQWSSPSALTSRTVSPDQRQKSVRARAGTRVHGWMKTPAWVQHLHGLKYLLIQPWGPRPSRWSRRRSSQRTRIGRQGVRATERMAR